MRELRVTLETVTPLFLGGADARGQPELRPPAFRGALRYWLRAALGGVIGNDCKSVRIAESEVFGSTDASLGGSSAVIVRLTATNLPPPQKYSRGKTIHTQRGGQALRQPSGQDYLYWSMADSGKPEKGNYQPPKEYYPTGASFELVLSERPGASNADGALDQAAAALWLLLHLGGVGSRSRRTAGSLSAQHACEWRDLKFHLEATSPTQAANSLRAGITAALNIVRDGRKSISIDGQPGFDLLHPTTSRVWVLGMWPNANQAVDAIGSAMRDFRSYREPDHKNVATWLKGGPVPGVERAAFGLPLPFRYSGTPGLSGVVQGRLMEPAIERRASPLWLRVVRTTSGLCVGIATLFNAAFLPPTEMLHLKVGKKEVGRPTPATTNYTLIEQWVAEKFPNHREVEYA